MHWLAVNEREQISHDFEAMRRSSLQRMYEVVLFKQSRDKASGQALTVDQVAELYSQKVRMSNVSEPVSRNFVLSAIRVHKVLFSVPFIRIFLMTCEDKHGVRNPFDSIQKLDVIGMRLKDSADLKWAITCLCDMWQMGSVGETIGERQLKGQAPGMQGKGLVELAMLKRSLRDVLLNDFVNAKGYAPEVLSQMQSLTVDIASYRRTFGMPGKIAPTDLTCRAGWKDLPSSLSFSLSSSSSSSSPSSSSCSQESAEKVFRLLEDLGAASRSEGIGRAEPDDDSGGRVGRAPRAAREGRGGDVQEPWAASGFGVPSLRISCSPRSTMATSRRTLSSGGAPKRCSRTPRSATSWLRRTRATGTRSGRFPRPQK